MLEQIVWFEEYARAGATLAAQRVVRRAQSRRPNVDRLRQPGAEGISLAEDSRGRSHLVSGLLRTRRRLGPRERENARSYRRRHADHRRPQDLVELRRHRRLAGTADPHRCERQDLRRAHLGDLPDEFARHHRAPDPNDGGTAQVLRSVLRLGARAALQRRRRREQRLGDGDVHIELRTRHRRARTADRTHDQSRATAGRVPF